MKETFKEENVEFLKVDIDKIADIWDFLGNEFNRSNIPVNLMYPSDTKRLPIILPEVLTPDIVIKGVKAAG